MMQFKNVALGMAVAILAWMPSTVTSLRASPRVAVSPVAALPGNCQNCSEDDLGDFCIGGAEYGYNSCGTGWIMRIDGDGNVVFAFSTCDGAGAGCGVYYTLDALDGSGQRQTGASMRERWVSYPNGRVLLDCAGVIVDHEMSQERAEQLRHRLRTLTL